MIAASCFCESADREHPSADSIAKLVRGELTAEEKRSVVRHLLSGCPECLAELARLWQLGGRSE